MAAQGRPPLMLDIVEEHFEELDFLCEQRESVIFAPDWNLEEFAEVEERAEAHLDALRMAEAHAVDIARKHLAGDETFAATAATLVFMESGVPELQVEVLEAFESAEAPETREGIRLGLRHSRIDHIRAKLLELTTDANQDLAAAASDVLAFHRIAVPVLERLRGAKEPTVRILVYGAIGRLRSLTSPDDLTTALTDPDQDVQRAALQAAALSGLPGLENLCRGAATHLTAPNLEALSFLGIFGDRSDVQPLLSAARVEGTAEAALASLGALGNAHAIPLLIELMEDEKSARDASRAFQRIVGEVDLDQEQEPVPADADADADAEEDTAEDPLPDAEKARAWWEANAERFPPDGRWQGGLEVSDAHSVLDLVSLEARRDLYLAARAAADANVPEIELEARRVPPRS